MGGEGVSRIGSSVDGEVAVRIGAGSGVSVMLEVVGWAQPVRVSTNMRKGAINDFGKGYFVNIFSSIGWIG